MKVTSLLREASLRSSHKNSTDNTAHEVSVVLGLAHIRVY